LFVPTSKTALVGLADIAPESDNDRSWSSCDGQVVEIHEVPGDHFSMMLGDAAALIADHLNKLLASAAQSGDREPQSSAR
jgi:thioesterase domain-containing protein